MENNQTCSCALGLDKGKLIDMLNVALSEEWLSYYQYWIGARVVEGAMRSEIESEFLEHANEELRHAEMLARRIGELDGTPVLDPQMWFTLARCKYEVPSDFKVDSILVQNLHSEKCAIARYREIADYTSGKDYTTAQIAVEILADEIDHASDITQYQRDILVMRASLVGK
ncbi:MAG: ferritin-like domain-containing protein [Rikenellaceae bacterium]